MRSTSQGNSVDLSAKAASHPPPRATGSVQRYDASGSGAVAVDRTAASLSFRFADDHTVLDVGLSAQTVERPSHLIAVEQDQIGAASRFYGAIFLRVADGFSRRARP